MTDQPEALRVADELSDLAKACGPEHWPLERVAARLLREQHDEIKRLREEVRKWQKSFGGHLYVKTEDYAELVGERDALKAENEALRRDAERYLYLRNRDPEEVLIKNGKLAGVWIDWEDDLSGLQLLTGDDADAAIDAARGEK